MSFTNLTSKLRVNQVNHPLTPAVTTDSITAITGTTATGAGTVISDGGYTITERGVVWSTSINPTTSDGKATSAGTLGAFTASITGLSGGTLYYVRAYAINSQGTSYDSNMTFTTTSAASATISMFMLMGMGM